MVRKTRIIKHTLYKFFMVVFFFLPREASSNSINFDSLNGNNMQYILSNDRGEKEVKDFINNVLRQCDADKFIEISRKTLGNKPDSSNAEFYRSLKPQISRTTPLIPFIAKVKSLHHQQKILSAQLQNLIGNRVVKNYVEIGTPGTYINGLKDSMLIEQATVINNTQGLIDYIHGSSWSLSRKFKSYDKFVPLNNYDAIAEEQIPSNSVDVVSCVIGLHHIPTEKLQPFVSSIYRILKPGGIFILRDHDAKDDEVKSIVQAAHTIFNLVTMELDLEGEVKEFRNFQPLSHWIKLLTMNGFKEATCDKLYQTGDPTLNAMVKFIKPLQLESEVISEIEDYPYYKRDLTKTFLSAPEWHNVLTTVEYTKFIYNKPFYEFPYFSSIGSFWEVFGKSWNEARKYQSFWQVLTADYTQMNLFIGAFMTIEYSLKGIISAPLCWLIQDAEPRKIQMLVQDPKNEVSEVFSGAHVIREFGINDLKLVEVSRYKAFMESIKSLNNNFALQIASIAGNDRIQFTLKHFPATAAILDSALGVKKLYNWSFPTVVDQEFTAVTVEVAYLKDFIEIISRNNIEVFYIHDF